MDSGRFETFIDAILAIMMTVMILKIPQPDTLTINGLWDLKILYFTYFISFIVIASIWNNHRKLFNKIKTIDNVVIFVYLTLTFIITLIPFFTSWVSQHPYDIAPEVCYGLIFIITNMLYLFTTHVAVRRDRCNKDLDNLKFTKINILNIIVFVLGFGFGLTIYPISILISCCISVIIWNLPYSLIYKKGDYCGN